MWNNLTSLVEAILWLYYRTTCLGENLIIGLWVMNNEDVLYVGVDELCNRSNTYKVVFLGKKQNGEWNLKMFDIDTDCLGLGGFGFLIQ